MIAETRPVSSRWLWVPGGCDRVFPLSSVLTTLLPCMEWAWRTEFRFASWVFTFPLRTVMTTLKMFHCLTRKRRQLTDRKNPKSGMRISCKGWVSLWCCFSVDWCQQWVSGQSGCESAGEDCVLPVCFSVWDEMTSHIFSGNNWHGILLSTVSKSAKPIIWTLVFLILTFVPRTHRFF